MRSKAFLASFLHDSEIIEGRALRVLNSIDHDDYLRVQFLLDAHLREEAIELAVDLLDIARDAAAIERKRFFLSKPVVVVSHLIHRHIGVHPIASKYGTALTVVFAGAYMATNPIHGIPHFIWDGIAYTIHGFGAAPIAESLLRRLSNRK